MTTRNAEDDDGDIGRLLVDAGPRREPAAAMRQRVHASTLALFEALPAATPISAPAHTPASADRRGASRWPRAIAAAFVLAAAGALLWQSLPRGGEQVVASVNFSTGSWWIDGVPAARNALVPASARVRTADDSALELRLRDGTLVRVDQHTEFTVGAANRIELLRGRIYVDAGGTAGHVRIATEFATVSDIGTQFEVQVEQAALTVLVREGQVRLEGDHMQLAPGVPLTASAHAGIGESLRVDAAGRIVRGHVATTAAHWGWLAGARPAYALDSGSLHDFLVWSAAESGLQLRYHSEAVRRAAVSTRTRGNIDGMSPEEAIANVLATTRLRRANAAPHELLVDFADGD